MEREWEGGRERGREGVGREGLGKAGDSICMSEKLYLLCTRVKDEHRCGKT